MTPQGMFKEALGRRGHRYLLPHRVRRDPVKDALYDAAQRLVDGGQARWLTNGLGPGIELTGKPLDPPD